MTAAVASTTIESTAVKATVTAVAPAGVVTAMRAVCVACCHPAPVTVGATVTLTTPSPTVGNHNARDGRNRAHDHENDEDETHHEIAVS